MLLGREFIYSRRELSEFASELSNRWHVELKCSFSTSGSALMGWGLGFNIRCIMSRNFSHMPDELIRCAKCLSSFRSLCSFLISSSFNQGAGGRVIFVLHRGACLSSQDLKRELKISSFSFGSPKPKTVLKGTPPRSSLNFASSKCFSLRNSL